MNLLDLFVWFLDVMITPALNFKLLYHRVISYENKTLYSISFLRENHASGTSDPYRVPT